MLRDVAAEVKTDFATAKRPGVKTKSLQRHVLDKQQGEEIYAKGQPQKQQQDASCGKAIEGRTSQM